MMTGRVVWLRRVGEGWAKGGRRVWHTCQSEDDDVTKMQLSGRWRRQAAVGFGRKSTTGFGISDFVVKIWGRKYGKYECREERGIDFSCFRTKMRVQGWTLGKLLESVR